MVFYDVVVAGMSGREFGDAFRRRFPGVPVILAGTGRALTRELRDLVSEMVAHLDEVAA